MNARQLAKRVVEAVLRLAPRSPSHMRGRVLILAYHNVVPDELAGRGDQSLHLPINAFTGQLDLLQQYCRILPLADLLSGTRFDEGPAVALTFDDAYRGAVEFALPELARRGLPATMFVAPGLLGSASFWWDELADGAGELSAAVRTRVLDSQAGRPDRVSQNRRRGEPESRLPACYGCASADQLDALGRIGSVTLGAHTWNHPNLTRVNPADLAEELSRPLEWLRASSAPTLPVLAYPYGLSSPTVEAAVAKAGYDVALRIEGGWFEGLGERWRIPRFNVPAGLSRDGLMLRLSGVLSLGAVG